MALQHLYGERVRGCRAAGGARHVAELRGLRTRLYASRDVRAVRVTVVVAQVVHL